VTTLRQARTSLGEVYLKLTESDVRLLQFRPDVIKYRIGILAARRYIANGIEQYFLIH
jgi:hypothetical protein